VPPRDPSQALQKCRRNYKNSYWTNATTRLGGNVCRTLPPSLQAMQWTPHSAWSTFSNPWKAAIDLPDHAASQGGYRHMSLRFGEIPASLAPMELLLLADPSPSKVRSYLADSTCFAASLDGTVVGIGVVRPIGEGAH